MEYPSIPTDNLYKFVALSGAALIALFILIPSQRISELERLSVQLEGESNVLRVEIEQDQPEIKRLNGKAKVLESELDAARQSPSGGGFDNQKFQSRIEKLKTEYKSVSDRLNEHQIKGVKLGAKNDELKVVLTELRGVTFTLFAGAIVGVLMTSWGFRNWYTRVQTLQDELLRLQVKAAPPNQSLNSDPVATSQIPPDTK